MIVEKTKTGFSAYAEKYPVYTVGQNLDDLKTQIIEALNLYLKKEGKTVTDKDLKLRLDLALLQHKPNGLLKASSRGRDLSEIMNLPISCFSYCTES